MGQIIAFQCRSCEAEITISPAAVDSVSCPVCKKSQQVRVPRPMLEKQLVTACIACGHEDLYVQKDFNRNAGVGVVTAGALVSVYFFYHQEPIYAMGALAGTAVVDFLMYRLVGDVTVCYACHALYRGFNKNPELEPFELKKLEKYGGRSPRF